MHTPFGYVNRKGQWHTDPKDAAVIAAVYTHYLTLGSVEAVARALAAKNQK